MAKFICPNCEELNEEHRNYCKRCGTWLLNTNYPAKKFDNKTDIKKLRKRYVNNGNSNAKWLKVILYIIGGTGIFFSFILILSSNGNSSKIIEYLSVIFALYGLIGILLSFITGIVYILSKGLYASKKHIFSVFLPSFIATVIGIGIIVSGHINNTIEATHLAHEYSLNSVGLGDSATFVNEKLGAPPSKRKWTDNNVQHLIYEYSQVNIDISDKKVDMIDSRDIEYKTVHGIGMGSTVQEITKAYQYYPLYVDFYGSEYYIKDSNNIILFNILYNKVNEIMVFQTKSFDKGALNLFYYNELPAEINSLSDLKKYSVRWLKNQSKLKAEIDSKMAQIQQQNEYENRFDPTKIEKTKKVILEISSALHKYAQDHNGLYPIDEKSGGPDLDALTERYQSENGGKVYMSYKDPQLDGWGNGFVYICPKGKRYILETLAAYSPGTDGTILYMSSKMSSPSSTDPSKIDPDFYGYDGNGN